MIGGTLLATSKSVLKVMYTPEWIRTIAISNTLTTIFVLQGIMLVYDITQEKTFDNISKWLRNIEEVRMKETSLFCFKTKLGNCCKMISIVLVH